MKEVLSKFADLLRESVIIQGMLALSVMGIIVHAAVTHTFAELPKEFWLVGGTIVGYYFKSKNDVQVKSLVKSMALALSRRDLDIPE